MPNTININIERTGFPVKIGSIELWFDSSLENLRNFYNIEEIAQEKLKEAREKAKHIHFPTDVDIEDIDIKTVDAAFDVQKEFIAAQYDILFGDGTFREIYKKYSDILALESTLDTVGTAISKRIQEQEKERESKLEQAKNEALQKKKARQKK